MSVAFLLSVKCDPLVWTQSALPPLLLLLPLPLIQNSSPNDPALLEGPLEPPSSYPRSKDILRKVGPTADRLGTSNNQLTFLTAVITNHSGGDIDDLSLSKSTARRSRASVRKGGAKEILFLFFIIELIV